MVARLMLMRRNAEKRKAARVAEEGSTGVSFSFVLFLWLRFLWMLLSNWTRADLPLNWFFELGRKPKSSIIQVSLSLLSCLKNQISTRRDLTFPFLTFTPFIPTRLLRGPHRSNQPFFQVRTSTLNPLPSSPSLMLQTNALSFCSFSRYDY